MKKFSTFTLITGLIFIGVGIFFLFYPDNALKTVIKIAAILAIVKGIFDLLSFLRLNSQTGKKDYGLIFSGVLILVLGIILFFNTTIGTLITGILFAIWFFFESIGTLLTLRFFNQKSGFAYYLLLILTVFALIMSILMFALPFQAALSFTLITGLYFVFQGIVLAIISLKFKSWFTVK